MKKICLTFFLSFLLCVFVSEARAQVGEQRSGISVGAHGGVALNRISFNPTIKQKMHIGPSFGVAARFTSEIYFKLICALQVELNFSNLGWRENIIDANSNPLPDKYERNQNYIQVPMLARLALGNENGLTGYLVAGPQIGFMISENSRRSSTWTLNSEGNPDRPNGMYAQYDMAADRKFDYGITAGLGMELATKVGRFSLEGRYYYGLGDIYKNGKKDVFGRSNHGTITALMFYFFDIKR